MRLARCLFLFPGEIIGSPTFGAMFHRKERHDVPSYVAVDAQWQPTLGQLESTDWHVTGWQLATLMEMTDALFKGWSIRRTSWHSPVQHAFILPQRPGVLGMEDPRSGQSITQVTYKQLLENEIDMNRPIDLESPTWLIRPADYVIDYDPQEEEEGPQSE